MVELDWGGVTRSPRLKGNEGEYGEVVRPGFMYPFMPAQSLPSAPDSDIVSARGTALMSASGVSSL